MKCYETSFLYAFDISKMSFLKVNIQKYNNCIYNLFFLHYCSVCMDMHKNIFLKNILQI